MNVQIVPMELCHVPRVAELEALCFSMPWSEALLAGELDRENTVYFVARTEDGDLLGYAGFYTVLDEGCITNVAVYPEYRKRGIAGMLLEALLDAGRAQSLACITLEVRESNDAALCLYRKQGFEVVGKRRNYYEKPQEDAILMLRQLP